MPPSNHFVPPFRYEDYRTVLSAIDAKDTESKAMVINESYNAFIRRYSGHQIPIPGARENKSLINYAGWGWRDIDFDNAMATIAFTREGIAFCENNKWGYKERLLTHKEFGKFQQYIIEAWLLEDGNHIDGVERSFRVLDDWLQTLIINDYNGDMNLPF